MSQGERQQGHIRPFKSSSLERHLATDPGRDGAHGAWIAVEVVGEGTRDGMWAAGAGRGCELGWGVGGTFETV